MPSEFEPPIDRYDFFGEEALSNRQQRVLQCLSCLQDRHTGLIDADLRHINLCTGLTSLQRYRAICALRLKGALESISPENEMYPTDLAVNDGRRIDSITEYGYENLDDSKVCGFSRDKHPKGFNSYNDAYGGTGETRREVLDCLRCLGAQGLAATDARIARCTGQNQDGVRGILERMIGSGELQAASEKQVDFAVKSIKQRKAYEPTAKTADVLVPDEMPFCTAVEDELRAVLDHRKPQQLAILDGIASRAVTQGDAITIASKELRGLAPESSLYYFLGLLTRAGYLVEDQTTSIGRSFTITEEGKLLMMVRQDDVRTTSADRSDK